MMDVSMAKPVGPVAFPRPADRCDALEAIALVLRAGALADLFEDLAAWVAGVEVIEGLKRAGFTVGIRRQDHDVFYLLVSPVAGEMTSPNHVVQARPWCVMARR